jgi:peptidoglycan hydrolase CwlO-like protein
MIISAIKDTSSFLILLAYTTIAYSTLFKILEDGEIKEITDTLKLAFQLNLGDFDPDKYSVGQYIVFIIAAIMNLIIMLNLLISILGDSYDKVQFTMIETDYEQMTEVIIEMERMMIWNRDKKLARYIHKFELFKNEFSEVEWEGRIRIMQDSLSVIKTEVRDLETNLEKKIEKIAESQTNLEKKIEEIAESQTNLEKNLEKKIAESQTNLEKKMDDIYQLLQALKEGSSSQT